MCIIDSQSSEPPGIFQNRLKDVCFSKVETYDNSRTFLVQVDGSR